jgi:hypothetical protein
MPASFTSIIYTEELKERNWNFYKQNSKIGLVMTLDKEYRCEAVQAVKLLLLPFIRSESICILSKFSVYYL